MKEQNVHLAKQLLVRQVTPQGTSSLQLCLTKEFRRNVARIDGKQNHHTNSKHIDVT